MHSWLDINAQIHPSLICSVSSWFSLFWSLGSASLCFAALCPPPIVGSVRAQPQQKNRPRCTLILLLVIFNFEILKCEWMRRVIWWGFPMKYSSQAVRRVRAYNEWKGTKFTRCGRTELQEVKLQEVKLHHYIIFVQLFKITGSRFESWQEVWRIKH